MRLSSGLAGGEAVGAHDDGDAAGDDAVGLGIVNWTVPIMDSVLTWPNVNVDRCSAAMRPRRAAARDQSRRANRAAGPEAPGR
jgi:hypothetical protein